MQAARMTRNKLGAGLPRWLVSPPNMPPAEQSVANVVGRQTMPPPFLTLMNRRKS